MASVFYIGGHAGRYTCDLSKQCHKCVTVVQKRLIKFDAWIANVRA